MTKKEEYIKKFGKRMCKCGEELVPHKALFKDIIVYTCPKSNIFNRKKHSVSRAFYAKIKPTEMKLKVISK